MGRYRAMSTAEPAPYQGAPLGAHMNDPSATRPDEVGTMTGKWLGALLSTPPHQFRLIDGTDAKVHLSPRSEGHGW